MRGIRLVLAGAALTASSCTPAMVNQQSEEQTIRAISSDWQRAIVAKDVEKIVSIHAADAVVMFSNSPQATGSAAIRAAYAGLVNIPGISLMWTPTKIDVVSPTVATDFGSYTLAYDGPQGRVSDSGNYTTIWHKVDGQWRVAVDAPVTATPMPAAGAAPQVMDLADMQSSSGAAVTWGDFTSPGFDPGAKIAVLHGNPGAKGDYTVRLQFPDGYKIPVHWHPNGEHATVLSGTLGLAMGNTADWKAVRDYSSGDFLYLPAHHSHFGIARGVTMVQLHGEGPLEIKLGAGM